MSAIRAGIARNGIRNSHLLAIAPTGSISLLANAIPTGIEPVFDFVYRQRVRDPDSQGRHIEVEDYAYRCWRNAHGDKPVPDWFVTAQALPPEAPIAMQAALQPGSRQACGLL